MNVLIVYAHPHPESFNRAVLERLQRGLGSGAHTTEVVDLYAEGFDPVLRFDAQHPRRDLNQDPATARYRQLVTWADHLVFVYPVWWYGLPAILKGWFDRVFVAGFAYTSVRGLPKGLLTGKSAWVVSTIDSPSWFVRLLRGDAEGRVIRKAILGYCGIGPVQRFLLTGVKSSTPRARTRWLETLEVRATGLTAPAGQRDRGSLTQSRTRSARRTMTPGSETA